MTVIWAINFPVRKSKKARSYQTVLCLSELFIMGLILTVVLLLVLHLRTIRLPEWLCAACRVIRVFR